MKLSARAKTLPGFLKQIVSTFKCDYFSDEDISYMAVDYNLVCEDGGRKSFSRICWETYAVLMVFIFPLGIPLTFGVLLYQRRYDLCPKMKVRGVSYILFRQDDWGKEVEPPEGSKQRCAHLLFLTEMYEPHCFWFEVVESWRRLMLSCILVLFDDGSLMRSTVAIFVCLFNIKIFSYYEPFVDYDDDRLAEAAQWQLFVILFVVLLIHMDKLSNDDDYFLSPFLIMVTIFSFVLMLALFVRIWYQHSFPLSSKSDKSRRVSNSSAVTPILDNESSVNRSLTFSVVPSDLTTFTGQGGAEPVNNKEIGEPALEQLTLRVDSWEKRLQECLSSEKCQESICRELYEYLGFEDFFPGLGQGSRKISELFARSEAQIPENISDITDFKDLLEVLAGPIAKVKEMQKLGAMGAVKESDIIDQKRRAETDGSRYACVIDMDVNSSMTHSNESSNISQDLLDNGAQDRYIGRDAERQTSTKSEELAVDNEDDNASSFYSSDGSLRYIRQEPGERSQEVDLENEDDNSSFYSSDGSLRNIRQEPRDVSQGIAVNNEDDNSSFYSSDASDRADDKDRYVQAPEAGRSIHRERRELKEQEVAADSDDDISSAYSSD